MKPEQIARICHEANRIYCEEARLTSSLPWWHASEALRASVCLGVQALFDNPFLTPEDMHIRWCEHKEATGWTYGEHKDETKKTHPCLRPYADLPLADRAKDTLFTNIVRALMPADILQNYARAQGERFAQAMGEHPATGVANVASFLSDDEVRNLKAAHGLDPDKPFDPSAPIVVAGPPSEAITTTTSEVLAQLGQGAPVTPAEQETSNGQGQQDLSADVAARQAAQADRDGREGSSQEEVDAG